MFIRSTCGRSVIVASLNSKPHISPCKKKKKKNQLAMALSTKYCKRDSITDLYTDEQGNILTKGDVTFCKKQTFVISAQPLRSNGIMRERGDRIPTLNIY